MKTTCSNYKIFPAILFVIIFFTESSIAQTILNLKVFIEGFYSGGGFMKNGFHGVTNVGCLNTDFVNISSDPLDVDSVKVTLIDTATLSPVERAIGILKTNGSLVLNFNTSSGRYYLKVNHRNSIETWSSSPVAIVAPSVSYDFSTSISQAYGSNMIDIGSQYGDPPTFAMFSGDVNQDLTVDRLDSIIEDSAAYYTYTGYAVEDITGDGIVESADLGIMINAYFFHRTCRKPLLSGIENLNNPFSGIIIFPNPVSDKLIIENKNFIGEIRLKDIIGKLIYSEEINLTHSEIDFNRFSSGVYLLEIIKGDKIFYKKIIKE